MTRLALRVAARFQRANLFRQKGKAYRDRRRRYRQNKAKSKRESQQWRKRHRAYLRRYRQQAKRNPTQHRMRRHAVVLAEDIQVWDLVKDRPGDVKDLSIDDETITVNYGLDNETYDVLDFLDRTVFLDPQEEDTMFGMLDELYHPDEDDDEDDDAKAE